MYIRYGKWSSDGGGFDHRTSSGFDEGGGSGLSGETDRRVSELGWVEIGDERVYAAGGDGGYTGNLCLVLISFGR